MNPFKPTTQYYRIYEMMARGREVSIYDQPELHVGCLHKRITDMRKRGVQINTRIVKTIAYHSLAPVKAEQTRLFNDHARPD